MVHPHEFMPLIAIFATFGSGFGIFYLWITARNRERMALIERGLSAEIFKEASDENTQRFGALKWGLTMIGLGGGVLAGKVLSRLLHADPTSIVFAMLLLFGGVGLLVYYAIASRIKPH